MTGFTTPWLFQHGTATWFAYERPKLSSCEAPNDGACIMVMLEIPHFLSLVRWPSKSINQISVRPGLDV